MTHWVRDEAGYVHLPVVVGLCGERFAKRQGRQVSRAVWVCNLLAGHPGAHAVEPWARA